MSVTVVIVSNSGLCCCVCVTSFEHELTPLFVDNVVLKIFITVFTCELNQSGLLFYLGMLD